MRGVGWHVIEHVPSHLPVLVGRGVGQHRPHQHYADGQESHGDAKQGPLRPLCFPGRFLDGFYWEKLFVYLSDCVGRVVGHCGQLYLVTQIGRNVNKGAGIVLKIHSLNFIQTSLETIEM